MHTLEKDGWRIHHHGDYSGMIQFASPTNVLFEVPYSVLEALVAEKIRSERITRLEDASDKQVLWNTFYA